MVSWNYTYSETKCRRFRNWHIVSQVPCTGRFKFLGGQSNTIPLLTAHNQCMDLGREATFKHLHPCYMFTAVKHVVIGQHLIYSKATDACVIVYVTSSCRQGSFCFHEDKYRSWKKCFCAFVKAAFTTREAMISRTFNLAHCDIHVLTYT